MAESITQNIYDNPLFFAEYGKLARSQHGLAGAPEWPVLRQMILSRDSNDIQGCRVLDLGCGYGWFCRWSREAGASFIQGIDVSERMIARAREMEPEQFVSPTTTRPISYEIHDLESIDLAPSSYDIVYSSLTFHYLENLPRLFRQIHVCLKNPGGRLVFSVEHPAFSAPINPGPNWRQVEEEGSQNVIWPLNSYGDEGVRTTDWLGLKGVRKHHRTIESYVTLLLACGFALTALKEWVPSKEDLEAHPEWADERHRPYFLLIAADKTPTRQL